MITPEEKAEILFLNSKVERRKLEIEVKEWKTAFESLALWVRNNLNEIDLFQFMNKVVELRPRKEK